MDVCKIQKSLYEGPKMSHSKQKNDKGKPNLVFLIEIAAGILKALPSKADDSRIHPDFFIRISTGKVMASLIETFFFFTNLEHFLEHFSGRSNILYVFQKLKKM